MLVDCIVESVTTAGIGTMVVEATAVCVVISEAAVDEVLVTPSVWVA